MRRTVRRLLVVLATLLVLAPAGSAGAAPVAGVNVAPVTEQAIDDALATGARYARYFVGWDVMEPRRGELSASGLATYGHVTDRLVAGGARPIFVVTNAPGWSHPSSSDVRTPPDDPAAFGSFMGRLAGSPQLRGKGVVYELWNEPDAPEFWQPSPDAAKYAAMVRAAYSAVKAADPAAVVILGPTTGNNHAWLEALYAHGLTGSHFDGVAVHTDTACLVSPPDAFYRENGRISRWSFLGYREVKATLAAHGDGGKRIWMTEFGWSSTTSLCQRGMWAGQKAAGVTEAQQAEFMTRAWHCMSQDDAIAVAAWFTLYDNPDPSLIEEVRHYGLLRGPGGPPKPAWTAFRTYATRGDTLAGPCGDLDAPTIDVRRPTANLQFTRALRIEAVATDPSGVGRITFQADGRKIRNFTGAAVASGKAVSLEWQGSKKLSFGRHTITVIAVDPQGNTSSSSVPVVRVRRLAATLPTSIRLGKVTRLGRTVSVGGRVIKTGELGLSGKVRVAWQQRRGGRWKKIHGGLRNANRAFRFTQRLKRPGRWRVQVRYLGAAPYKSSVATSAPFTVK